MYCWWLSKIGLTSCLSRSSITVGGHWWKSCHQEVSCNSENNFILQWEVDSWSTKEESVGIRTSKGSRFLSNWFLFPSRLDYSGIALLIMGSFVPWLYYSFYCNPQPCFIYLIVICVLGIAAIIVSQWDMFATPEYRGVRAGKTWS